MAHRKLSHSWKTKWRPIFDVMPTTFPPENYEINGKWHENRRHKTLIIVTLKKKTDFFLSKTLFVCAHVFVFIFSTRPTTKRGRVKEKRNRFIHCFISTVCHIFVTPRRAKEEQSLKRMKTKNDFTHSNKWDAEHNLIIISCRPHISGPTNFRVSVVRQCDECAQSPKWKMHK